MVSVAGSVAKEAAEQGIRVNAVTPGAIETTALIGLAAASGISSPSVNASGRILRLTAPLTSWLASDTLGGKRCLPGAPRARPAVEREKHT